MTKVPFAELHRVFIVTELQSDGEKNTQGTLRMSMDEMTMEDKCERLEPCGM